MLIGEIVRKTGLSKDGIRYYEELGLLHSAPVKAGSRTYRDYDETTFERLSLIALGKRFGFSLKEMAETLDLILADKISREERSRRLIDKVKELDKEIAQIQVVRNELMAIAQRPDKEFVDERLKELGLWIE